MPVFLYFWKHFSIVDRLARRCVGRRQLLLLLQKLLLLDGHEILRVDDRYLISPDALGAVVDDDAADKRRTS